MCKTGGADGPVRGKGGQEGAPSFESGCGAPFTGSVVAGVVSISNNREKHRRKSCPRSLQQEDHEYGMNRDQSVVISLEKRSRS